MLILDGKQVAKALRLEIATEAKAFKESHGRAPGLGVILVGEAPASKVYVRNKELACQKLGLHSVLRTLPQESSMDQLLTEIHTLNKDNLIDGFLVQLPLPKGLNSEQATQAIDPRKDSDGLTYENMGLLWAGKPRVVPCTPQGVMTLLEYYKIKPKGMRAVVVGRSQIVGKPMAQLLLQADATVTVVHSKTPDIRAYTQNADLVVVAAGQREFLGKEDFKKDSIVIDVGIHGSGAGQKVVGDVRFDELENWVQAATPVPGGVGPLTIATLLKNTIHLARQRMKS